MLERRSGSWVVGVYVVAAFGMRTGVVGSEEPMFVKFVCGDLELPVGGGVVSSS